MSAIEEIGDQRQGMYANKAGVGWPASPTGRASLMDLNTEPDLILADNVLTIGFAADPDAVREYVPYPLELDGSGTIYLKTTERWGYTHRNSEEFISPERLNQTESYLWIPCTYEGVQYFFVPFSWGNRDWLAYGGRLSGMPHKWAKVQMTNFQPAHPIYYGPHAGARICSTVENMGLVHRCYADLKKQITPDELPFRWTDDFCPRFLGHRYIWDSVEGKPLRNDLVVHYGDRCHISNIWAGDGWAHFYEAENEEVLQFQPRRMLGAWYFSLTFDHQTTPPYTIYDFGDRSPYAKPDSAD
jgi:hypothetical protein